MKKDNTNECFKITGDAVISIGIPALYGMTGYLVGHPIAVFSKMNGAYFLANVKTGHYRMILDSNRCLTGFGPKDFACEDILPGCSTMTDCRRAVRYWFGRYSDYRNGMIALVWTIQPDGRFWSDEDGFGATNDEEIKLYACFDKNLKVISPWRHMKDGKIILKKPKKR